MALLLAPRAGLLVITLMLCAAWDASAQFGKRPPPPKAPVNKGDLKFIRCQVCEAMAKHAVQAVKGLNGESKASEADILEYVEKMCDPDQDSGDWITQYDVVESGDKLELKDTGALGKCKSECRTIARACEEISEELDLTDLSAKLVKGKKRKDVTQWMCYDSSEVCLAKVPPVPADRKPGEAHQPLEAQEIKTMKMLRSMKAAGLSGSMYNRDTMMEELEEMRSAYDDDPELDAMIKETQEKLKGGGEPEEAAAAATGSAGLSDAVSDTVKAATETLQSAAEVVREGASKVVDGVAGMASNLYKKVMGKNADGEL